MIHTIRRPLPPRCIVGMVHLAALPGSPLAAESMETIIQRALEDAQSLISGGVHALLVENMHDRPYQRGSVGPETVAAITAACLAIRKADFVPKTMPIGLQVLAAANREALAIASVADLDFIRAEAFVFAHIADEGFLQAQAADLLRYRRRISAEHVRIFTDIKKKHSSHAITADVDLTETAHAAEFFLTDGLIVTGTRTAVPPSLEELQAVRKASHLPLLVGSGVTEENIASFLATADAVIVGSSLKKLGDWRNNVDAQAVAQLVAAAEES